MATTIREARSGATGPPSPAGRRTRAGTAAAYGAAVLAFAYAALSLYWAAGGTALLATVGGTIEELARRGGLPAVALGSAATVLKVAGGLLALALARRWDRTITRRWLLAAAGIASVTLICYGAMQVTAGALVLSGALQPAGVVDHAALRWHVALWDMWFLVWGLLLAGATTASWRHRGRRMRSGQRCARRRRGPALILSPVPARLSPRLAAIVNALPLQPHSRVLEIGCGPGAAARAVAARLTTGHILAIDRSAAATTQAAAAAPEEIASGRMSIRQAAAEDFVLQAGEEPYDIVFAVRVGALDGRHPQAGQRVLQRIAAATTAGARLSSTAATRFRNYRSRADLPSPPWPAPAANDKMIHTIRQLNHGKCLPHGRQR